jgi:hypothetical protein
VDDKDVDHSPAHFRRDREERGDSAAGVLAPHDWHDWDQRDDSSSGRICVCLCV